MNTKFKAHLIVLPIFAVAIFLGVFDPLLLVKGFVYGMLALIVVLMYFLFYMLVSDAIDLYRRRKEIDQKREQSRKELSEQLEKTRKHYRGAK